MKKIILLLICITNFFLAYATANPIVSPDTYAFASTQDAERFTALTQEIRCVVCQNQNLAESNAPLANDLRNKIYFLVTEKKSNQEIKTYLVKRYGEFILLRPPFKYTTFLLWFFPLLGLVVAAFLIQQFFRRQNSML